MRILCFKGVYSSFAFLVMHSLVPPSLRLEMKGLVCLASHTCKDGMWYFVVITLNSSSFVFIVNDYAKFQKVFSSKCLPYTMPGIEKRYIFPSKCVRKIVRACYAFEWSDWFNQILILWHKYVILDTPDPSFLSKGPH